MRVVVKQLSVVKHQGREWLFGIRMSRFRHAIGQILQAMFVNTMLPGLTTMMLFLDASSPPSPTMAATDDYLQTHYLPTNQALFPFYRDLTPRHTACLACHRAGAGLARHGDFLPQESGAAVLSH